MFSELITELNKKKRIIIFVLLLFLCFFVLGEIAFADTTPATDTNAPSTTQTGVATVVKVLQIFSAFASVFISLMTYLATLFLSPEWVNGSIFGMSAYFKQIRILISNIVYLVFAFILVWVAFMNIIGRGDDKYQLKQVLPRFIIGILIVPLSWFMVQFVISLSSILTITALNLPFDTFKQYEDTIGGIMIPKECTINLSSEAIAGTSDGGGDTKPNGFWDCSESSGKVPLKNLLNSDQSSDSIFGVIATYTYGVLGVENFDKLANGELNKVKTLFDLVIMCGFDLIYIVVYGILMIALGIVLCVRGIYLWIYVMMSPLFGLMYFFSKEEGGEGFFEKFNPKQFISLALVPVFTMLALSFGLLFIYLVGKGMTDEDKTKIIGRTIDNVKITTNEADNTSTIELGSGYKLNIKGNPSSMEGVTDVFKIIGKGGLGAIGTLIMKIMGIVVLWGTIMAALRTSAITKEIIEPLYNFGTKVGSLAKSLPQYVPIIPGGGSMKALQDYGTNLEQFMTTNVGRGQSDKFWSTFGLGELSGVDKIVKDAQTASNNSMGNIIGRYFGEKDGDMTNAIKDPRFKTILTNILNSSSINLKPEDKKDLEPLLAETNTERGALKFLNKLEMATNTKIITKGTLGIHIEADFREWVESQTKDSNNSSKSSEQTNQNPEPPKNKNVDLKFDYKNASNNDLSFEFKAQYDNAGNFKITKNNGNDYTETQLKDILKNITENELKQAFDTNGTDSNLADAIINSLKAKLSPDGKDEIFKKP